MQDVAKGEDSLGSALALAFVLAFALALARVDFSLSRSVDNKA
jgi:hypothetical protein